MKKLVLLTVSFIILSLNSDLNGMRDRDHVLKKQRSESELRAAYPQQKKSTESREIKAEKLLFFTLVKRSIDLSNAAFGWNSNFEVVDQGIVDGEGKSVPIGIFSLQGASCESRDVFSYTPRCFLAGKDGILWDIRGIQEHALNSRSWFEKHPFQLATLAGLVGVGSGWGLKALWESYHSK